MIFFRLFFVCFLVVFSVFCCFPALVLTYFEKVILKNFTFFENFYFFDQNGQNFDIFRKIWKKFHKNHKKLLKKVKHMHHKNLYVESRRFLSEKSQFSRFSRNRQKWPKFRNFLRIFHTKSEIFLLKFEKKHSNSCVFY